MQLTLQSLIFFDHNLRQKPQGFTKLQINHKTMQLLNNPSHSLKQGEGFLVLVWSYKVGTRKECHATYSIVCYVCMFVKKRRLYRCVVELGYFEFKLVGRNFSLLYIPFYLSVFKVSFSGFL